MDNNTILSGGKIINMDRAKNTDWYKEYIKSNKKTILYTYYDKSKKNVPGAGTCRTISIIQGLDNYGKDKSAKLLKVDIDYNLMLRHILNEKISDQIYVCNNDYIIFSNLKNDSNMEDFIPNDSIDDNMATIKSSFKVGNQEWEIIMMATSESFWDIIFENKGIIVLILLNFIIPTMVIYFIGRSITNRLSIVATYIGKVEKAQFEVIECQEGEDEIGKLIKSYNLMVLKIKDLIEVVFKGKTEKQALELSKKQAELKAIQSQVNPHFLYNTLETIRMRSLIKHEEETADIIGELAILFRKSMSWGSDFVTIEEEMSFVEKYINIQKYRFGDKIKYSKYVMETCKGYRIPKLVIANFVENACIHGIESSVEDGVISVTVTEDDMYLYIEVSDNGEGISNAELNDLRKLLDHADSKLLNKTKSTGILNSFLRLQMYCDGKVHFEIDSEPNSGTDISICIPLNCTNSVVHNVSPNVKQEV